MIQNRMPDPDQAGGGTAVLPAPSAAPTQAPSPTPAPAPSIPAAPGTQNNASAPPPNSPPPSSGPKDFDTERDDALSAAFKVDGKHQQQPREKSAEPVKPMDAPETAKEAAAPLETPALHANDADELAALDKLPAPKARDAQAQQKYDSDWNAIKEKYGNLVRAERAKLSKALAERDAKLAEFTGKLTEAEKKAQTLEGYRVAIDLQADPAFIAKYEKPIEDKKGEMTSYLKSIGVPADAIASLNNVWSDDYSLRKITKQLEDQDAVVGETFREHVVELRRMQKDQQKAVREANVKRDELLKEAREGNSRKQTEREVAFKQRFDQVLQMREGEGPASVPRWGFLVQMAVPSNATPEQRAAIEKHNATVNQNQEHVQQLARSDDPNERMDQAVLARAFPLMVERFNVIAQEREQYAKELAAIKKSSSFSQPNNQQPKTTQAPSRPVDKSMDAGQAIDAVFGVR